MKEMSQRHSQLDCLPPVLPYSNIASEAFEVEFDVLNQEESWFLMNQRYKENNQLMIKTHTDDSIHYQVMLQ